MHAFFFTPLQTPSHNTVDTVLDANIKLAATNAKPKLRVAVYADNNVEIKRPLTMNQIPFAQQ